MWRHHTCRVLMNAAWQRTAPANASMLRNATWQCTVLSNTQHARKGCRAMHSASGTQHPIQSLMPLHSAGEHKASTERPHGDFKHTARIEQLHGVAHHCQTHTQKGYMAMHSTVKPAACIKKLQDNAQHRQTRSMHKKAALPAPSQKLQHA